jgi:hypothetical protein
MRGVRLLIPLVVLSLMALPAGAARAKVPQGFVGMNVDGPMFDPSVNQSQQLDRMVASGVERVRVEFNWSAAQPYRTWSDVPSSEKVLFTNGPGNVPTNFVYTDSFVKEAAQRKVSLLPVVLYAPSWDASPRGNHFQPAHDAPYGRYLTALVNRYGPHGTFWSTHRSVPYWPITSWQVWNEPNLSYYWDTTPFAPSYVALLRVAHAAIKKADPKATVVLGSLVNYGWRGLSLIYDIRGAGKLFDAVASNPYTAKPSGVITILGRMRRTMDKHGDHAKPLIATEVGWPSAQGKTKQNFGFNTTERGQAQKLTQLLPLLASNRRSLGLQSFYYYTWISTDHRGAVSWAFSGLLQWTGSRVRDKPAYGAFRSTALRLEGCHRKGPTPFSCH